MVGEVQKRGNLKTLFVRGTIAFGIEARYRPTTRSPFNSGHVAIFHIAGDRNMTADEVIRELEYIVAQIKYRGRLGETYVDWDTSNKLTEIANKIESY